MECRDTKPKTEGRSGQEMTLVLGRAVYSMIAAMHRKLESLAPSVWILSAASADFLSDSNLA